MSAPYEEIAGTPTTPPGYRWVLRWQPGASSSIAGIIVLSAMFVGFAVLTAEFAVLAWDGEAPAGGAVMMGSIALIFPITAFPLASEPAIRTVDRGIVVSRSRLRNPGFRMAPPLIGAGAGCTMLGSEVRSAGLVALGVAMTAFFVLLTATALLPQRTLTLTHEYIALGTAWIVPWESVTKLYGETTRGRASVPYVRFRTKDPTTLSGASKKKYVLMPGAWGLDENGLLSLMNFMVENPTARATVTAEQFRAMLAAPPGSS
ncbi:hypothetical protein ACGF5S_04460 [Nocardia nova]|uniref:hypothetical protein n=1 Tax=Nocardia nova TaxID=37330 RepID=UPI0037200587